MIERNSMRITASDQINRKIQLKLSTKNFPMSTYMPIFLLCPLKVQEDGTEYYLMLQEEKHTTTEDYFMIDVRKYLTLPIET